MSRSRPVLLLSLTLLLAAGSAPPPAAAQAAEEEDLLNRALAELEAGRLPEALALLEPLRDRPDAAPPALAVLGALYLEAERPADALAVLGPLAEQEQASAPVLYNAGRAALAVGQVALGEAFLERSVALEPATPAARELGLLRGLQGDLAAAYRLLVPWARSHPEDAEARQAAAMAALRLKRLPEAEELLADLPQEDPQVRLLWANLLLLQGQPHGAADMLRPLVEAPPEGQAPEVPEAVLEDARRMLAEAYLELGESARTVALLENQAEGPGTALLLARARFQGGDLEEALATLAPYAEPLLTIEIDRSDPRVGRAEEIAREYGRWLVTAGRHGDAVAYLRLAADLLPDEKQTWQALAQALAATGDAEGSRAALDRFQELARDSEPESVRLERLRTARDDPTGRELDRARRLIEEGRREEALEVLRAEAALGLQDPRPRLLESRLLLVLGRPDEALEAAEAALALAPENPDAIYQRGAVRVALGELERGEADLRRALELAPDHVPALNDLAVVLLVEGDRDEARRLLERVLAIRPGDPQATETLGRLEGG